MSKQFILGSTLGALVSIGMLAAVPVLAARGNFSKFGPHFSTERHVEIQTALQNRDYQAWKALMDETGRGGEILDAITEDNFEIFAEMEDKMLAGDREGADALREQLGLPVRMGPDCMGDGADDKGLGDPEHRAQIEEAIKNRDYAAWKALMEETPGKGSKMLDTITEENFPVYADMQEKMLAGDREGADALRQQLGLEGAGGFGGMMFEGRGMMGLGDPEHRAQIEEAIKNRDYAAWKALMEETPGKGSKMLDTITEENFPVYADMQEKMLAGDKEGAAALREQLGLEAPGAKFDGGKGWKKGLFPRQGRNGGGCPMGQAEPQEQE